MTELLLINGRETSGDLNCATVLKFAWKNSDKPKESG